MLISEEKLFGGNENQTFFNFRENDARPLWQCVAFYLLQ